MVTCALAGAGVVAGCEREAAGRSIDELVAERDAGVIAVLRALGRA
jgi:carnitine 3-dehydrogenase